MNLLAPFIILVIGLALCVLLNRWLWRPVWKLTRIDVKPIAPGVFHTTFTYNIDAAINFSNSDADFKPLGINWT